MPAQLLETADIETASDGYASRFAGPVGEYFLDVQTKSILELLLPDHPPGATVLDVGGGHAQLAIPMAAMGYRVAVTGSHDDCRRRLEPLLAQGRCSYQTCDMLHLPYPDNAFDVVAAFRLLPHVERWQQLVAELARVAARTVVADYPDIRSLNLFSFLLFRLKKRLEGNTRPFALFNRQQMIQELARNGMGNVRMRPEFFLPMVLHRKLGSARLSRLLEGGCRACGLTSILGSPIVLRADKYGARP